MWKVLPKFSVLKILGFLFCALTTSALVWLTNGWLGLVDFFQGKGLSTIVTIATPVLFLFVFIVWFGGSTAWKPFWRLPLIGKMLNQKVCPDLNGIWKGYAIPSNNNNNGVALKTEVLLTIKANLFGFDMSLESLSGYQRSKVIQSEIYKDPRDGSFEISYIFEAEVETPEPTDDSKFDGAAKLKVRYLDRGVELSGTYWTNRAWQRGLQTAGAIKLSREST